MRTKRAVMNSFSSLLLQIAAAVCGFFLPRLILREFGSEVNGAISSITQFLGYISLLEAGVGGVTRAALYKPIAQRDTGKISGIINATQIFFRRIAFLFIGYTIILAATFKFISGTGLGWSYTASLVTILSAGIFMQYYYGMSYSILFHADQRHYVSTAMQIGTVILNTIISIAMLKAGFGVHVIKLAAAGIYVIRPILLNRFARKSFGLLSSAPPDNEAIRQKWNGFGHHIAFYVHNNVDVIVVTVILGLKWASVYAVYYMIIGGVKNIVNALTGGSEAAWGNIIAKKEQQVLLTRFQMVETLSSIVIVTLFSTTGILLFDFIGIYTKSVTDIAYVNIPVGILFIISESFHCVKQIYHHLILAAGHYRETQKGAFIEAGLNLALSFILAYFIGMPGILIATIVATCYRIVDYAFHLKKTILHRNMSVIFKRQFINIVNASVILLICGMIPFSVPDTYSQWALKAAVVLVISSALTLLWQSLFYRGQVKGIMLTLKGVLSARRR